MTSRFRLTDWVPLPLLLVLVACVTWQASTRSATVLRVTDYWPTSLCADSGAYEDSGWNFDEVLTFTCRDGSNTVLSTVLFPNSTSTYITRDWPIPTDWDGPISARLFWFSSTTTGNVVFQIQTSCVADGEALDPAWNTASTVTDATQGTTVRANTATVTNITTTGCAAGEMMHVKVMRDPAHGSDTMAGDVELRGVEWTYRRSL